MPIPAQATNALVRNLRASAVNIASKRRMQIEKVMYLGDEGGIGCVLKVPGQEDTAVVVSLTHLRLPILTRSHQTYEHTKSHARRNWQKNQTGTKFWTSA